MSVKLDIRLAAVIAALAWTASIPPSAGAAPKPPHHHPTLDRSGRAQTGAASYYSRRESGRRTASGQPMRPNRLTAASKTLPLGTKARVTNTDNGRSVDVTVTDRGPFVKDRILDVSPAAADHLGMKDAGVSPVSVRPLAIPPPGPPAPDPPAPRSPTPGR